MNNKMSRSREAVKIGIKAAAEQHRDIHGNVDLTKLRNENPSVYAKISYYFDNIENFLIDMGDFKLDTYTISRSAIRNRLAYDWLKSLREDDDMKWEEIGLMYSKSKAYMNRLYNSLGKAFEENDDKHETAGTSVNRNVIRNRLAYDRINNLIKDQEMTVEDIALMYLVPQDFMAGFYDNMKQTFSS